MHRTPPPAPHIRGVGGPEIEAIAAAFRDQLTRKQLLFFDKSMTYGLNSEPIASMPGTIELDQ